MENMRQSHIQQRKGSRLILFTLPLQGHINPMLQLANILYSKGFSISIIQTNFNSINPSNYPHFTFHSIPDGLLESEASTEDIILFLSILNVKCVEPFRNCLAKLLSDVLEEPVACLITDLVWCFAQPVAEGFKLPTIVVRTTSLCSFLGFAAFPLLLDKGYLPIQGENSLQEIRFLVWIKMATKILMTKLKFRYFIAIKTILLKILMTNFYI